jgi:hypothetical protein
MICPLQAVANSVYSHYDSPQYIMWTNENRQTCSKPEIWAVCKRHQPPTPEADSNPYSYENQRKRQEARRLQEFYDR